MRNNGQAHKKDEFLAAYKDLIEDLNAEARKSGRNEDFPELKDPLPIESIHFYESLVVIHKKCISNQK